MEAISISSAWLPAKPNQLLHHAITTPQTRPCFPVCLIRAHSFARHFLSVRSLRGVSAGLPRAINVAEAIPHREREQSRTAESPRRYRTLKDDERSSWKKKERGGNEGRTPAKSRAEDKARKQRKMGIWTRKDKEEEERMAEKRNKRPKQLCKADAELRAGLDMFSKTGDVIRAIALYDSTVEQGIKLEQYHYNVLLYLCSSAASGVIQPAKSGSSSVNDFSVEPTKYLPEHEEEIVAESKEVVDKDGSMDKTNKMNDGSVLIQVSKDLSNYARSRGFEIFEKMKSENIPMSEAALTSVARMAASMGDGDRAFDMVKQMKPQNVTPRLRSYGPALSAFCCKGDVERAFEVEAHMLESGVYPEEPELAALLSASITAGRGDKVYYLLHKLRTKVRQVSPSTAALLEAWFKSSAATKVGKRKWDANLVAQAIEDGGGGWHGLGWLGRGKWNVTRSSIDDNGFCMACKDKLVIIDIDPVETENFATSVASLAIKRERNTNFQKFQKWLDYYGPFEAVVDAANVGLFSQKRFSINKVNAIVSAIRQKLPTKKWPLIIVHNKRLLEDKMNGPINMKVLEKWRNADAIYATPTGSNDDWYWLYAAIKFKCLIVTNDEMRDHIFQILGNDFFPRWKERHQVHFSFHDGSFDFHLPPPCSVVIQESQKGHWHIPISSESEQERKGDWLCVTRAKETTASPDSVTGVSRAKKKRTTTKLDTHLQGETTNNQVAPNEHLSGMAIEGGFRRHRRTAGDHNIIKHHTIVNHIEAAEKLCGCVIDFQI